MPTVSSESESEHSGKVFTLPNSLEKDKDSDAIGDNDPDVQGEGEEGGVVRSSVQSLTVSGNSLFAPGVEDSSFQIEDEIEDISMHEDADAPAVEPAAQGVAQEAGQPVAQNPPQPVVKVTPQPVAQTPPQPVVKVTPQPVAENPPSQVEDIESESFLQSHIPSH